MTVKNSTLNQLINMTHLQIRLECTGDVITAISEAHTLAKAAKKILHLNFQEGTSISINPESYVQDLITIAQLSIKLKSAEKK